MFTLPEDGGAGMPNSNRNKFWIGFDLGGTKMLAVVYDAKGREIGRKRRKTKGQQGTKAGLERMAETIEQALLDANVSASQLAGIGVGAPGPLDMNKGVIPVTPNLAWENADVKGVLQKVFGCPVVVLNDVDAGLYGEYAAGAARGATTVVGLFPGTGLGGGCIYRGQVLRGSVWSCMEIGHLQVMPDGPLCGCGQRGCLEAVASRLAISSAAAAAAYRGDAPNLLAEAGMDLSQIRSGAIARAIAAGDQVIEDIVRTAARWLGVGAAACVNLFAPDTLLLGGGLVEEMPSLYCEEVEKSARSRVMPAFRKIFSVRAASLGDDAVVTGAAAWMQQQLKAVE